MEFVNELKEGLKIDLMLLLTNVVKGVSNNGSPYISLTLQDRTGAIDGKKWDANEADVAIAQVGTVIRVSADVIEYRGNLQLKILGLSLVDQNSLDFTRFTMPSPIPQEELVRKLNHYLKAIKDEDCRNIVEAIVSNHYQQFISYPAATRNHHEFGSGLLYHTISMVELAYALQSFYENIDTDILIAGIILHDIGKTKELSGPIATKYTTEGKLIGHISLMVAEIYEVSNKLGIKSEVPLLLEHMILSHHGEKDFGSPIPPLTREAFILHMVDDFDAKMNIIDKALLGVPEGEFSQRVQAMDGHTFYQPKKRK